MSDEDQHRRDVREYVERRDVFRVHAAVFAVGMAVMFVVNWAVNAAAGVSGNLWAWWSIWALIGWGIGVTIHGLVVRMSRPPAPGRPSRLDRQVDAILESEAVDEQR